MDVLENLIKLIDWVPPFYETSMSCIANTIGPCPYAFQHQNHCPLVSLVFAKWTITESHNLNWDKAQLSTGRKWV